MKTLTRTHTNKEHRDTNEQAPKRHRDNTHKIQKLRQKRVKLHGKEQREDRLQSEMELGEEWPRNCEKRVSCKKGLPTRPLRFAKAAAASMFTTQGGAACSAPSGAEFFTCGRATK